MNRSIIFIGILLTMIGGRTFGDEPVDSLMDLLKRNLPRDSAKVNVLNKLAEEHQYIDFEKILYYADRALEISEDIGYRLGIAEAYNNLGTYYRRQGIYDKSIDYYFDALDIMEELDNEKGIAKCYNLIGILYYYLDNLDLSFEYYSNALEINYKQKDKKWIAGNSNNIGMIYEKWKEYDKAIEYYMKALEINLELGNKNWIANTYDNIGSLYLLMGNPKSLEYFTKRLQITEEQQDTAGTSLSLAYLGEYYLSQKDPEVALPYLIRAYDYAIITGSLSLKQKSSGLLSKAYAALADYQNALSYEKTNKHLSDSLNLTTNIEKLTRLQMQFRNRHDQQLKELEFKKTKTVQTTVAVVLFFVLVFALLLFNRQRITTKQNKLEQNNLKLETVLLQEELDFKDKMLQENIKYLLDINQLLTETIDKFNTLRLASKPENKHVLREIITILQSGVNDDIWKEFEVRFNQVHKDFYNKLNNSFPDLTSNEKKLCAFLKLNMTSKEISSITSLSIKSIETARSRLRKKLNLQDKSHSLTDFFANF